MTRDRPVSRGEAAAWSQLRLLRQEGFAFRREQRIGAYWADFVCLRRRLIVEVDGGVHDLPGAAEHDAQRDKWLEAEGFKVLRFRDAVILSEANWLERVREVLQSREEAPYRNRYRATTLEGGGQGGGESVELGASGVGASERATGNIEARLTQPPTPFPSREGG